MIEFVVPGVPVPQPRPRAVRGRSRRATVRMIQAPSEHPIHGYKAEIALRARHAHRGGPLYGPLSVEVLFLLPRPQALIWKRKPMPRAYAPTKPDLDNLLKALLDGLNGVLWVDDAQVVRLTASKQLAAGDERPATLIRIELHHGDTERKR